jgi:Spy/CpxP family protein refolding chaperone
MMAWWKHARQHAHGHGHQHGACEASAGCGPSEQHGGHHGHHGWHGGEDAFAGDHDGEFGGGSFGVRRPLRFLAYKLELNEKQVAELAHILNELKTERAQGAVDHRRTVAGFADAIEAEAFDETKAGAAAADRVKSAERLREAVVKALGRIHVLLDPEQRRRFAYLIRTGALTL